jgi:hypothetical protein
MTAMNGPRRDASAKRGGDGAERGGLGHRVTSEEVVDKILAASGESTGFYGTHEATVRPVSRGEIAAPLARLP